MITSSRLCNLFNWGAVLGVLFLAIRVEGGSVVVPAWAFSGGNVRIHADSAEYADAGPVVGSGSEEPWGWRVDYEVDIPVDGKYALQVCYAAAEPRPVNVLLDGRRVGGVCSGVTFGSSDSDTPTWNSSGARWEAVTQRGKVVTLGGRDLLSRGKHTVTLTRRQPLPHLVALHLETDEEFPQDWKPPRYKVRDLDSLPAGFREATLPPALELARVKAAGSLTIPACSFDRGTARIYAAPEKYATHAPLAGDLEPGSTDGVVEYDIEFPVTADYTLQILYTAVESRPTEVFLDGRRLGRCCTGITLNTAGFVRPHEFSVNSERTRAESLYDYEKGTLLPLSITKGKHTLRLARSGPLPHLLSLRFETGADFPDEWVPPERKVDLARVPPAQRGVFLPPEAVNVAALRLAVEETIKEFGPRYSRGARDLERLSELEARQRSADEGSPERKQEISEALTALRSEIMRGHPLLDFDKLLFIKRSSKGYGHTYRDQQDGVVGGSLCILSPVSPDGEVTPLIPELEGGLFDRFDLSFDARKLVFAWRSEDQPFRIYEIDLDPAAGKMLPGSLRQLTFGGDEEVESLRRQVDGGQRRFHDIDPCYLPDGKIIFTSTRAERIVFCQSSASVTTLYLMDADGGNLHRLSESPVNETAPSMLPDGRVIYTRWEYVDKGLAHAQSLWTIRPDGSGVDHLYKNNTTWPAGMSSARAIPGSRQIVTIGGNHHFTAIGPVILVDPLRSRSAPGAMTCITPETGFPPRYGYPADQSKFGSFMDPYPLSEEFYLVSHVLGVPRGKKRAPYALYLLDRWGNRAELLRDPDLSCFQPMPLRPRPRPMTLAGDSTTSDPLAGEKKASLFMQDVYQGMTGIERGRVKYVRVMGALEWPWDQEGISWSLGVDPHRKKVYGLAKVHEDGSSYFTVPAGENLFFQALDEDFMALQEMASFINMMPGEQRSCIGCHETRHKAPVMARGWTMAAGHPPQELVPQPGDCGPRVVDFNVDVQPILDEHCVSCHSGEEPDGRLDLVNVPVGKFSRSFDNLLNSGQICYRAGGKAGIQSVPPLTHGSRASKLPALLMEGHPSSPSASPGQAQVQLSREEMVRIVTWIDANVPYYGTYRGNRSIEDKDHPNYRALPVAMKQTTP